MKRILLKKEVVEGASMPPGYGVAYYDWTMYRGVAYPVPLNLVVGAWVRFWHWVRMWHPTSVERKVQEAYARGRQAGWDARSMALLTDFDRWLAAEKDKRTRSHTT